MPPNRTWTIRQVAEAAGVSTQTVSRVLNNRPDVARDTFDRVQKVIAETGYAPNLLARGLTQGRSHTIGVVAYGLDYFGPSSVITGIEREAADRGYSISLNLLHEPETDAVDGLLNSLRARQVDGIIWAIPDIGDNRRWFRSHSPQLAIPVVLVGGMGGQGSLPSIGIENAMIGRLATAHLLAGGAQHDRHRHRAADLVGGATARGGLARDPALARARGGSVADRRRATGRPTAGSRPSMRCSRPGRTSTRSTPPTTRWRSGSSTRPIASAAGCRRTWRWSARTTSPRHPTSGRP